VAADEQPTPAAGTAAVTVHSAIENAARILRNAEMVTDQALMERLEALADSWNSLARTLLADRDNRDD
jgi:hypothetical protein